MNQHIISPGCGCTADILFEDPLTFALKPVSTIRGMKVIRAKISIGKLKVPNIYLLGRYVIEIKTSCDVIEVRQIFIGFSLT